ncbi:MAG TPA: TIGR02679 family protein [Thermoanaerobaculia bacterium]|nr:TIGR02679 family protein [Thermoanaerobaculia bacterium]
MSAEAGELLRFLGRRELRRLWMEVRDRLERLGGLRGTVLLADAGEEERRMVADLLGLATVPGGELRIRLDRLDRVLRESRFAVDLRTAVELLGGPLRDRPGERAEERERRQKLWEDAARHPVVAARPALQLWLDALRSGGLLRRLAGHGGERLLLEQALAVLAALSRRPDAVRLPVLASEVLGDSHALDAGRPVTTLVLKALAREADLQPPRGAAERRQLWEQAGVVADDLSCQVLVLGLAPVGGGPVGESLRALAAAGEPARITLRQLLNGDLAFPPGLEVRICENPVVVAAAADRWGPACPPLLCLEGFASYAAHTLLARLARHGAVFRYHGDFDWDGLRIANKLREVVPFQPWRFTTADYRAALTAGGERPSLHGYPAVASWDTELGGALAEAGLAVEEETVLGGLLGDLAKVPLRERS